MHWAPALLLNLVRSFRRPQVQDHAMPLGDHLEELRRRLLIALVVLALVFMVAFFFQIPLKEILIRPLRQAVGMLGEERARGLGLLAGSSRLLIPFSLEESIFTGMTISGYTAVAIGFPVLIYQLWAFVAPGLRANERGAMFWTLPAALLFFYGGVAFGYFVGIPYFYSWLLVLTSLDPTIREQFFRQSSYFEFLAVLTVVFGIIMDIPWVILVLVRLGLVTVRQITAQRRTIYVAAIILAAVLTPPDVISEVICFGMMLLLFEAGVLMARVLSSRAAAASSAPQPGA